MNLLKNMVCFLYLPAAGNPNLEFMGPFNRRFSIGLPSNVCFLRFGEEIQIEMIENVSGFPNLGLCITGNPKNIIIESEDKKLYHKTLFDVVPNGVLVDGNFKEV